MKETKIIGPTIEDDGTRVIFPIKRKIVICGNERERTLEKGQVVECYMCGEPIKLSPVSVINCNGFQYVCCIRCGAKVDAFYYMTRRKDTRHDGVLLKA